ncbi:prolyl oligopeptidase family serine peptidase [Streptomyces tropicalis]|uniref:Prolyl oligopeptidase family serine peptidase n=1 Tax=Streptomyces tropicalis TaxID=3034234 RepID=A0ABT6A3B5_9ACTN|nr:prolyl oligopeptidase family serine peptidase [Streptomyces tropicalis]MDF3299143.1 prolyl oligopeptidase family serine peptidase [Streptomyces tropicalis]
MAADARNPLTGAPAPAPFPSAPEPGTADGDAAGPSAPATPPPGAPAGEEPARGSPGAPGPPDVHGDGLSHGNGHRHGEDDDGPVAGSGAAGRVRAFRVDARSGGERAEEAAGTARPAPAAVPLPDTAAPHETPTLLTAHGCWYPSVDPGGRFVAFICDRAGVPQLWVGPVDGGEAHLLDGDPHPVTEVSWSPDGRWIAYTTAPGGGEHTRVLCVRPDGTGRRLLAGGEPDSSAHLGCWQHDGSALAVTVAEAIPEPGHGELEPPPARLGAVAQVPAGSWIPVGPRDTSRAAAGPGGGAVPPYDLSGASLTAPGARTLSAEPSPKTLSAYLVDPDGASAPVLVASERAAATLRVCDVSRDGRLALVRRGPRGRREALVVRTRDLRVMCRVRVADADPWIGGFAPDGRTLWLRSDHGREYAALYAVRLDSAGRRRSLTVAAEREGCGLELLTLDRSGLGATLSWNVRGVSELEVSALSPATTGAESHPFDGREPEDGAGAEDGAGPDGRAAALGPTRRVSLPHEVVTRVALTADADAPVVALSGSQRRPGIWWLPPGAALRTPWSATDEETVPGGRPPVRPVPVHPVARDGLGLGGWYYRAAGRSPGEPAPCVLHLHGGPEEQERPTFDPLYHELLGRGLDVFAPDVRGSSGHGRSFVDADLGTGRFAAIEDVAACAAHVVLAGLADPRRLAVMGRSYGGYLTMASLVWHPELFRTGVAVCGMSDFATFFAGTEPWIAESAAHKYGHPERDRELLRSLSPMSRVDALRVPVLTVHGEHDTNVPPGESEQFVRAARERGLEAELLVLREEGHDFRRADNRRAFRRAAADWMERHLGG